MQQSKTLLKTRHAVLTVLQGAMEIFYWFPAALLTYLVLPIRVSFWTYYGALIPLMALGFAWGKLQRGKESIHRAFITVLVALAAGCAALYLLIQTFGGPFHPLAWAGALITSAVFFRGSAFASSGWKNYIPIEYFWVSFGLSCAMYVITLIIPNIRETNLYPVFLNVLLPYEHLLLAAVLIGLFFNLFFNNAQQIRKVSDIGESVMSMKDLLHNQILVLMIILLIVLSFFLMFIADIIIVIGLLTIMALSLTYVVRENIPKFIRKIPLYIGVGLILYVLYRLFNFAMYLVSALIENRERSEPRPQEEAAFGESYRAFFETYGNVMLYVAAGLFVIFLIIFIGDLKRIAAWIIQRAKALIHEFWNWLMTKDKSADSGFEDEMTSLRPSDDAVSSARPLKHWMQHRLMKWNDLTDNKERIRYVYSRLIMRAMSKGFPFRAARTPDEIAHDLRQWELKQQQKRRRSKKMTEGERDYKDLSELYNRVRYGNLDVDADDVHRMKEKYGD